MGAVHGGFALRAAGAVMLGVILASGLRAQTRVADLVTAARVQLRAGNADSGLALLRVALDPTTPGSSTDRMNAFVWRGVFEYYKGRDSLARESFREALLIDPRLEVAGLAQIDSGLALEFEAVRQSIPVPQTATRPTTALARLAAGISTDTLFSCVPDCHGLDQPPRILSGMSETVTVESGGTPIMGGVAVVRFVVDTAGGVEAASISVISSPGATLRQTLIDHVRPARFTPARAQGRAVRVLMQWRLNVRTR